jgi:AcrR family transcriptional regulator
MSRLTKPEKTRRDILNAAFASIHRRGFQAAGLAEILAETKLTKGAFYHHFPSKAALGYAIIDETLKRRIEDWWIEPLAETKDPLDALAQLIQERLSSGIPDMLQLGCPLNNLTQEMAPIEEGFRQRLDALYRLWRKGLAKALARGQQNGTVRADVDADDASAFIIAALQGAFGLAKAAQSLDVFQDCMSGLTHYLASLRPGKRAPGP